MYIAYKYKRKIRFNTLYRKNTRVFLGNIDTFNDSRQKENQISKTMRNSLKKKIRPCI